MQIRLRKLLPCKLQEPDFRHTTIPWHSKQCRFCFIILNKCRFSFVSFFLVNSRNPILGTQRYRHLVFFRLLQCKAHQLFRSPMQSLSNFSGLQCKDSATFQVSNAKPQQFFRSPMQGLSKFCFSEFSFSELSFSKFPKQSLRVGVLTWLLIELALRIRICRRRSRCRL